MFRGEPVQAERMAGLSYLKTKLTKSTKDAKKTVRGRAERDNLRSRAEIDLIAPQ